VCTSSSAKSRTKGQGAGQYDKLFLFDLQSERGWGAEARGRGFEDSWPADSLDAMAARMEGRSGGAQEKLQEARARLEGIIQGYRPRGASEGRYDALLLLGRKIESSILSLANEI